MYKKTRKQERLVEYKVLKTPENYEHLELFLEEASARFEILHFNYFRNYIITKHRSKPMTEEAPEFKVVTTASNLKDIEKTLNEYHSNGYEPIAFSDFAIVLKKSHKKTVS